MVKQFSYSETKNISIFKILPNKRMSKYLRKIGFTWATSKDRESGLYFVRVAYSEPTEEKELLSLNKKMKEIEDNCIDFTLIYANPDKDNIFP